MDNITMVLATYRLSEDLMRIFIERNKTNFVKHDVKVVMVSDRNVDFDCEWVEVVVYPVEMETFALSRTINYGIRKIQDDCIIIKTDVDIYFTDDVLRHIKDVVEYNRAMVCICSNMGRYEDALTANWDLCVKRKAGRGACFAMTRRDWFEFKGYNEDIVGWGGEDFEMYRRVSSRIKLVESWEKPLYHINHSDRRNNNDKYWFVNSKKNVKIGKPMNWNRDEWGLAVGK